MVDKPIEEKWDGDTWKTPKYACLNCGYVVDAASPSPLDDDARAPKEGDYTVCLECSHIMVFKADCTVRDATPDEFMEFCSHPESLLLMRAMAELRKTKLWRRNHGEKPDRGA